MWLKENGIFKIWKMEKRNEDEYLLWQSDKFIYLFIFWNLLMFLYLTVLFLFNQYNIKLM